MPRPLKLKVKRRFIRSGDFSVYILKCKDGTYYTGSTNNLKKRLLQHRQGKGSKYTRIRRPLKLVWHKEYKYFKKAFSEERRIKGLTRIMKYKLIKNKWTGRK